jgi:hypothetical protein
LTSLADREIDEKGPPPVTGRTTFTSFSPTSEGAPGPQSGLAAITARTSLSRLPWIAMPVERANARANVPNLQRSPASMMPGIGVFSVVQALVRRVHRQARFERRIF